MREPGLGYKLMTAELGPEERAYILSRPIWFTADGTTKNFSNGFFYVQLNDAREDENVEQMTERWTDVQKRMMEIIWRTDYGTNTLLWESPCGHPAFVWWVDGDGIAHCADCGMVWTCP